MKELLHDLPADVLRAPASVLPAPRSLEALVLSRIAGCAPETERLVVAAAILGAEAKLTDAATLAGLADPLPALQEASSQRLLELDTAGGRRCVFPHVLIRAAVYRDIGVCRRAELHRAAARLTTGPAALAHRAAGCCGTDPGLAADLHAQAIEELDAGRRTEAVEHLLASVQIDNRGPGRDQRLLTAVSVLIDLGDAARARPYADEIMGLPPSTLRSLMLGRLAMLAGQYRPAEDWLADAWSALATAPPAEGEARLRESAAAAACQLALMLLGEHRIEDAAAWAQRAAQTAVTRIARACSCAVRSGSLIAAGQADEAAVLLEAELAQSDEGPARAMIRVALAAVLHRSDDLDGACAQMNAAGAGISGLPMAHQLEAMLLRAAVNYSSGAWEQAAAEAERLVILVDDLDQGWLRARVHLMAVYVAAGRGEWDRAADHADTAASHLVAAPGAFSPRNWPTHGQRSPSPATPRPRYRRCRGRRARRPRRLARLEPTRLTFWPAYLRPRAAGQAGEATRCCGRSRNSPAPDPAFGDGPRRPGPRPWKPPGTGRTPRVRRSWAASRTWRGWSCPSRRRRRGSNTAGSSGTSGAPARRLRTQRGAIPVRRSWRTAIPGPLRQRARPGRAVTAGVAPSRR